ncbi:glycosyltransferase [uncultured Nostoc sp.]|uniref:glycosyltransferase n=1 Tax=uncultured Nostoc sp. TaxID=340711 RepID=UPI0035CAFAA2
MWRSPTLRHSLGQAAQKTVIEHHTWEAIAQRILHIAGLNTPPQFQVEGDDKWDVQSHRKKLFPVYGEYYVISGLTFKNSMDYF